MFRGQSGVYVITCRVTLKAYVGQASDIDGRWRAHRSLLNKGTHTSQHMQRAWNKHGADAFAFGVLEFTAKDKTALTQAEQRWFDVLRPAFNSAPIAGSNLGLKQKPEHIAQRIKAITGRKRTLEQCKRIADAKIGHGIGRKQSAETIAKRIAAQIGRPRPDVSANLTGRKRPGHVVAALRAANDARFADRRARLLDAIKNNPGASLRRLAELSGCEREMVSKYLRARG